MKPFERFILFIQVHSKLRPFFFAKRNELGTYAPISTALPEDIVSIYEKLYLFPLKYRKEKELCEKIKRDILAHNKTLQAIQEAVDSWDKEKFLLNPYAFGKDKFEAAQKAAFDLSNFENVPLDHIRFRNEAKSFQVSYEEICRQYDAHVQFEALNDLSPFSYICIAKEKEIGAKIVEILSQFKEKDHLYYSFEKRAHLHERIKEHNEEYLEKASKNRLFDNINGHSLDQEQRRAVLTDESAVLVVAGAGSGKTLTICGKVEHLLNEEKVSPKDILLLSYSKKSADDLETKIKKISPNLTVGTFHAVGLSILNQTRGQLFAVEDQYKAIIETYFREELNKRPAILEKVLTYYGLYLYSIKHDKKYENDGDLYADLKKADFDTLKNLTNDFYGKETIKKEIVKSYEEMAIANWYFIHGVDYTYEAPYKVEMAGPDHRSYTPDFCIKGKHGSIYHEHYGVDKNGRAMQYSGDKEQEYLQTMAWKRRIHMFNHTVCLETYSYEFDDGTLFDKLEGELKKYGVEVRLLSPEEVEDALNSVYQQKPFFSFINLIRAFLSLYKASYRDEQGLKELRKRRFRTEYQRQRANLFLDIIADVYGYYMESLRASGKIDFDDMILQSTQELDTISSFAYKYIIVDEFQDISFSRMKFLKRLIQQGNSKLFAVGDDWQAIYRFTGCDLDIFLQFPSYFGNSALCKITTTHRNSQELQNIAGPFICKNPEQYRKSISSAKHLERPVRILYYDDAKYYAFLDVLREIASQDPKAHVLVLGRNRKDIESILLDIRIYVDNRRSEDTRKTIHCSFYPDLSITYNTVHGSKGLEEDYVILINAEDHRVGFPNKMEDDELLDLVLSHPSPYPFAEERRLWYVALTRTRTYTYILAPISNPSTFLDEIKDQCLLTKPDTVVDTKKTEISCPRCKTGRLVLRKRGSDGREFFGCSNYPYCQYALDQVEAATKGRRCPKCGDFLILKRGKNGPFYYCHNVKGCHYMARAYELPPRRGTFERKDK